MGEVNLKKSLATRLNRIEGQVKGLSKMIDAGADCKEILIQVSAIRAAINKVGALVVENSVKECLLSKLDTTEEIKSHSEKTKDIDQMISSLLMYLK